MAIPTADMRIEILAVRLLAESFDANLLFGERERAH